MSILTTKLGIRQHCTTERYVEAVRRVEAEAYHADYYSGGRFCRYCGVCQNGEKPQHDPNCPVKVLREIGGEICQPN